MKIEYNQVDVTVYISLQGELDECASKATRETLDAILSKSNIRKAVIDMSELSFMDSTGIGVLIGRYKKLHANGISLIIANPSNIVDKILRLSGMYNYMPKVMY